MQSIHLAEETTLYNFRVLPITMAHGTHQNSVTQQQQQPTQTQVGRIVDSIHLFACTFVDGESYVGDFTISMAFHRYSYKIGRVCVFIRASEYSYVNIRVFMCTAKGKKKKLASVMCAIGTVNRTSRDGSEPDRLDHCN